MNAKLCHRFIHNPLAVADLILVAARHEHKADRQITLAEELPAELLHLAPKES